MKKIHHKRVEAKAMEYGYSALFALVPREEAQKRLDYARKINDTLGTTIALMLLQNVNAYEKALKELE